MRWRDSSTINSIDNKSMKIVILKAHIELYNLTKLRNYETSILLSIIVLIYHCTYLSLYLSIILLIYHCTYLYLYLSISILIYIYTYLTSKLTVQAPEGSSPHVCKDMKGQDEKPLSDLSLGLGLNRIVSVPRYIEVQCNHSILQLFSKHVSVLLELYNS